MTIWIFCCKINLENYARRLSNDRQQKGTREELVDTKGDFILPSELFSNVREKAPQDENLNKTLEKVFRNIESSAQGHDSENDLKGLFDDLDLIGCLRILRSIWI